MKSAQDVGQAGNTRDVQHPVIDSELSTSNGTHSFGQVALGGPS